MTASELFVKALEQTGAEYIFGLPGDENLHFMEAVRKSSIEFVLVRQEQAAGFMANAYSLATGKLGIAMATLGAGAANLVTAVAQAKLGALPVLYITGQKDIHDSHQGGYQLLDVVKMMTPITKLSQTVTSGNMLPGIVHDGIRLALEERRGPTHIELPDDVAKQDLTSVDGGHHHGIIPFNPPTASVASEAALSKAVAMIGEAKRPVILVGGSANRPNIAEALRGFIKKTGIPFTPTMLGKGVMDERSPLYIGTATKTGLDYAHCAFQHADLILNVGHDVMEMNPFVMTPNSARVIHFNPFPAKGDIIYFPQHQVVGELAHSLSELTEKVSSYASNWTAKLANLTKQSVANKADDLAFPVKPQRLAKAVREFMGENDILSVDNGIHKMWFSRNYPTYQPNTLIIDNALGSMGPALPAAIALKLVHPDRTVVALAGDGGFVMNMQDLETAMRLKLDLIIIIMNDNGLGMIRMKQMSEGYGNLGVDFGNPDFVKLAESFGAKGYRIENTADLPNILNQAKVSGGVHIIDVPVDYRENKSLFQEIMMPKPKCEAFFK